MEISAGAFAFSGADHARLWIGEGHGVDLVMFLPFGDGLEDDAFHVGGKVAFAGFVEAHVGVGELFDVGEELGFGFGPILVGGLYLERGDHEGGNDGAILNVVHGAETPFFRFQDSFYRSRRRGKSPAEAAAGCPIIAYRMYRSRSLLAMSVLPDVRIGMLEMAACLEGWSRPVILVDAVDSAVYLNREAKCALDWDSAGCDGARALAARVAEMADGPRELELGLGGDRRWLASGIEAGDGQRVGVMLSGL